MNKIKRNLEEIREGFSILSGQDRLIYLVDLGKKIDPIDEHDEVDKNRIYACTSQTWVKIFIDNGIVTLKVNSESTMVNGLLKIIQTGFNGSDQKDILNFIDEFNSAEKLFEWMNIGSTISSQRQNGFIGSLNYIRDELNEK